MDAITLIMLRMLFALPLFAVMAWWAGRGKPALTRPRLDRRDRARLLGLLPASFLDFAGLAYITASLERLILYLNPTLVLLFGWHASTGAASRASRCWAWPSSYAGVLLVFGHELWTWGGSKRGGAAWGAFLVFLSAVSYAAYLVVQRRVRQAPRVAAPRRAGHHAWPACCASLQFVLTAADERGDRRWRPR